MTIDFTRKDIPNLIKDWEKVIYEYNRLHRPVYKWGLTCNGGRLGDSFLMNKSDVAKFYNQIKGIFNPIFFTIKLVYLED